MNGMKNWAVDVTSDNDSILMLVLQLVNNNHWDDAVCYKILEGPAGRKTLVLLSQPEPEAVLFQYPHSIQQAVKFIRTWLQNANLGPQPDTTKKAWRIFASGDPGFAGHCEHPIVAVQALWAYYSD